jgi:hypothetical protein
LDISKVVLVKFRRTASRGVEECVWGRCEAVDNANAEYRLIDGEEASEKQARELKTIVGVIEGF